MKAIKFLYIPIALFFLGCGQQVTYYIGDVINESKYTAQVTEVSTLSHIVSKNPIDGSNDIDLVAPSGKVFVVVKYEIKNTTSSNLMFLDFPDIKLIDSESNEIDPDIDANSSYTVSKELTRIDNSNASELTSGNDAFAKEMDQEYSIKPNEKSLKVEVFIVSKDKFNESWNIKVGDTLVSLKSKPVDGKSKTEASRNTAPAEVEQAISVKPISNNLASGMFICNTKKHRIIVAKQAENVYRYRSWNLPKTVTDKPDMEILQEGELSALGSGVCRHNEFTFNTGNAKITIDDSTCTEADAPKNVVGSLWIYVNGVYKNDYWCTN